MNAFHRWEQKNVPPQPDGMGSYMWHSNKEPISVTNMPNGHIANVLKNLKAYGIKHPVTFERSHELAKEWIEIFEAEFARRTAEKEARAKADKEYEEWTERQALIKEKRRKAKEKADEEYWDAFGEVGRHIRELAKQIKELKAEVKSLKGRR